MSQPLDSPSRRERALHDALDAVLFAEVSEHAELAQALDRRDGWHAASNATTAALLHVDLLIASARAGGPVSPADLLGSADAIRSSLERIRSFVGRGRSSSGQELIAVRGTVSLLSLVQDQVELCRQAYPKVAWTIESDEPPPAVVQDAPLLRSAVLHLLENAAEGDGRSGASRVVVSIVPPANRPTAFLRIRDDGPGFPSGSLQMPPPAFRSSKLERLGVGLFTCHRVALAVGGKLKLENHPGGGALVEFAVRPVVVDGA